MAICTLPIRPRWLDLAASRVLALMTTRDRIGRQYWCWRCADSLGYWVAWRMCWNRCQTNASALMIAMIHGGCSACWASRFRNPDCLPLLFFLLLAVPFGEIFIGPLMDFTADFTMGALQATGIPVLREGNSFLIPSGRWSVVEACSGTATLIASVTARLPVRLSNLPLVSDTLAIILLDLHSSCRSSRTGLRVCMIVTMTGHLSGMTLCGQGVDHLIYGWHCFSDWSCSLRFGSAVFGMKIAN